MSDLNQNIYGMVFFYFANCYNLLFFDIINYIVLTNLIIYNI